MNTGSCCSSCAQNFQRNMLINLLVSVRCAAQEIVTEAEAAEHANYEQPTSQFATSQFSSSPLPMGVCEIVREGLTKKVS